MNSKIQYALVKQDGTPATITHQDDMETPIVADTIEEMLWAIGDWSDYEFPS